MTTPWRGREKPVTKVRAELDPGTYDTGIKVTDGDIDAR